MIRPIEWTDQQTVRLLDQTQLPAAEIWLECRSVLDIAEAIRSMKIRGAPAIGVAAAMALALGVLQLEGERDAVLAELETLGTMLTETRPTAVNLAWAVQRMLQAARAYNGPDLKSHLVQEALRIQQEDEAMCRLIGQHGAALLPQRATVLTHCNAGALATAAFGTALGVIRAAWQAGKQIHVFVDETRPFLQGSRLTAWELQREQIPMTLITDNMAGHFIQQGRIHCIVVGADRICANGDTANKIGTYTLSVLAKVHQIPFYVAAPSSTIDFSLPDGSRIPIEERSPAEVTHLNGQLIAPAGIAAANPAFDVTYHENISAIITEKGVVYPPFAARLRELFP